MLSLTEFFSASHGPPRLEEWESKNKHDAFLFLTALIVKVHCWLFAGLSSLEPFQFANLMGWSTGILDVQFSEMGIHRRAYGPL